MTPLQQKVRELFDYDPESGVCTWLRDRQKAKRGEPIDDRYAYSRGYTIIGFHGRPYLLHRLIWLWMTGEFPNNEVDHINGVRNDNRWDNLRDVTRAQQMWNRVGWGESPYAGVSWNKPSSKWKAEITLNGDRYRIGLFETQEAARDAYLQFKVLFHGETRYTRDTQITQQENQSCR